MRRMLVAALAAGVLVYPMVPASASSGKPPAACITAVSAAKKIDALMAALSSDAAKAQDASAIAATTAKVTPLLRTVRQARTRCTRLGGKRPSVRTRACLAVIGVLPQLYQLQVEIEILIKSPDPSVTAQRDQIEAQFKADAHRCIGR